MTNVTMTVVRRTLVKGVARKKGSSISKEAEDREMSRIKCMHALASRSSLGSLHDPPLHLLVADSWPRDLIFRDWKYGDKGFTRSSDRNIVIRLVY